jgi:16S rRNA C967 or C1407 C5-methylase (RsmB/RsmF family)
MRRATEAVVVAAAEAEAPPRRGRLAWLHAVPHEWARAWEGAAASSAAEAPLPPPLPRLLREAHAGTQRTAAPERDARRRRSGSRGTAATA